MNTNQIIRFMADAWTRFCSYGKLEEIHKKALTLLSSVADIICRNAQAFTTDDPALLEDPFWGFIRDRIEAFPFEMRDAGVLMAAYTNRPCGKNGTQMNCLLRSTCIPVNMLDAFKKSHIYSIYLTGSFDDLMACFFSQSLPEMVETAIAEDQTGRFANWFKKAPEPTDTLPAGEEEKAPVNVLYDGVGFSYMCSACCEPIDPDDPLRNVEKPEDVMTPQELLLYKKYQEETDNPRRYVLRLKDGTAAMGLDFVYHICDCKEALEKAGIAASEEEIGDAWMQKALLAIYELCHSTEFQDIAAGCSIYVGDYTEETGHELLVAIPFEKRDKIEGIDQWLQDNAFTRINKAMTR